jgi:hypothetical protein
MFAFAGVRRCSWVVGYTLVALAGTASTGESDHDRQSQRCPSTGRTGDALERRWVDCTPESTARWAGDVRRIEPQTTKASKPRNANHERAKRSWYAHFVPGCQASGSAKLYSYFHSFAVRGLDF